MTNNDTPKSGTLDALHPDVRGYAELLSVNGFTVYAPPSVPTRNPQGLGFFHYSRTVDGRECYGTFSRDSYAFGEPSHSMPLTPSRLNGSGAIVGARWGDAETLGLDNMSPESVEYARIVARPANWCPFNAEPTREATQRANGGGSVPKRFYRGAVLPNAKPWGIGTHYAPVSVEGAE